MEHLPTLGKDGSDSEEDVANYLTHTRIVGNLHLNGINVSGTDIRSIKIGEQMTDEAISFILQWYLELAKVTV